MTPAEHVKKKHEHRHVRRQYHEDPRGVAQMRGDVTPYGMNNLNGTNPPVSGPAPGPMDIPQSGHLSPEQFVGYPGGFSTDAGNYTGVQAIEGAAGNGGAGGTGDTGDSGGAPS